MATETTDRLLESEEPEQTDCEMLIEAVRNRPLLYDQSSKQFKNSGRKELLWMEIASEMGKEVDWCKTKWKYLRDMYMRKKKALKGKSGDAAKRIRRWAFFELLTFLNTSVEDAETSGNVSTSPTADDGEDTSGDPNGKDTLGENVTPSSQNPIKRRKKEKDMTDPVEEALVNYLQQSSVDKTQPKDSHYHFANGIAHQLRSLPSSSFAKIKIQQVMYEVECSQFQQPEVVIHHTDVA